jgi:DNA mismatch endonuclease (patch repair protein)
MIAIPTPPPATSAAVRKTMQGNRGKDTRPEVALRKQLHRLGFRFRKHVAPGTGLRRRADIVFNQWRVAVFVDGCFWHGCPEHFTLPRQHAGYWAAKIARNRERDLGTDAALSAQGWSVVRIWEHEGAAQSAAIVAAVIADRQAKLDRRRAQPVTDQTRRRRRAPRDSCRNA